MATNGRILPNDPKDRIPPPAGKDDRFLEKIGPRNTRYNETVRANNKRVKRGQLKSIKKFPRGKAGDKIWKAKKRVAGK